MDGDPVTGEPKEDKRTVVSEDTTYTELFMRVFPDYLAMGMTYEQFWFGKPYLARDYRKAYESRRRLDEWGRWRMGAYIYNALLCVAPVMRAAFSKDKVEPGKYPDEPWPLTEKEARAKEEAREKENYERYIANMRAASDRELKRRAEAEEEKNKEASDDG